MASRIRPIGHEDRLSLVEHLDELRTRIILALAAFGVALGVCFWQNHALLKVVNHPLGHRKPVTLGVAEPFTTTLTVAAYAAIIVSMPVILYQVYAFVLPAFSPKEREVALPVMLAVPFLFVAGVVFGYYLVLPPAIKFLQNFNNDSYQVLIQAADPKTKVPLVWGRYVTGHSEQDDYTDGTTDVPVEGGYGPNYGSATITLEQMTGFSLFALKAVLSGRGDEIVDLTKVNLLRKWFS